MRAYILTKEEKDKIFNHCMPVGFVWSKLSGEIYVYSWKGWRAKDGTRMVYILDHQDWYPIENFTFLKIHPN